MLVLWYWNFWSVVYLTGMWMKLAAFKDNICSSNARCKFLPGKCTTFVQIDGKISFIYLLTSSSLYDEVLCIWLMYNDSCPNMLVIYRQMTKVLIPLNKGMWFITHINYGLKSRSMYHVVTYNLLQELSLNINGHRLLYPKQHSLEGAI